jgi:hypothetical protein
MKPWLCFSARITVYLWKLKNISNRSYRDNLNTHFKHNKSFQKVLILSR